MWRRYPGSPGPSKPASRAPDRTPPGLAGAAFFINLYARRVSTPSPSPGGTILFNLLDTPPDEAFDRLTRLASRALRVPIALVTVLDTDRQFFKSQCGLPEPFATMRETPLSLSFCQHVVADGAPLIIEDAREHPRFRNHPAIEELGVVAYAGIPLIREDGGPFGVLCAIDHEPRTWTEEDLRILSDLAGAAATEFEWQSSQDGEYRFRTIAETAPDVILVMNSGSQILFANSVVEQVFGYTPDEIIGQPMTVLIPERLREAHRTGLRRYLETGKRNIPWGGVELPGLTRSGDEIPVEISFGEYFRHDERFFTGFIRDIRERKRGEQERAALLAESEAQRAVLQSQALEMEQQMEALQEQASQLEEAQLEQEMANAELVTAEALYRRLVEASPYAIYVMDAGGILSELNAAAGKVLGQDPATVIGHHFAEVVVPEDLPLAGAMFARVMGGEDNVEFELSIRQASGGRRLMSFVATPIRDEGQVVGSQGIGRDITEERAREQQARLLAAAVESLSEGVSVVDAEDRVRYANPAYCRMLGCQPGDVEGTDFLDYVPEGPAREERAAMLRTVREQGGWVGRLLRRRLDGKMVPLEVLVGRVEHEGGEFFFAVSRDITEELARDQQLRRAERLASVGTLIGGVAHELNNPLHAIRNFAELLLMDERTPDDHEALSLIRREADRAAQIVSELRVLARGTQERIEQPVAVDLNDVVRHILRIRRYSLETGGIEVMEDLAPNVPPVLASRSEIEQVVLNLLVNAEQAMATGNSGRRLTLRTRRTRRGSAVEIADTGPGIPPEDRERIFDPFFTTKSPGEGTGLGLSLVHSIVTEHGGEIRLQSEVGKGSSFLVDLPRASKATTASASPPPAAEPRSKPLRVLLVDDEEAVRRVATRYLQRLGHQVDSAADGAEALRLMGASDYDVIVSDLRMPGMDGEELISRMRQEGRGLERKLVLLTGDAASHQAARVITDADVPVLIKPLGLTELAEVVERVGRPAAPAGGE